MFYAVQDTYRNQNYSGIVSESLRCQIFGVFGETYQKWQQRHSENIDFIDYFTESKILAGDKPHILRALLFFNLPEKLIFEDKVKPVKGYSFQANNEN